MSKRELFERADGLLLFKTSGYNQALNAVLNRVVLVRDLLASFRLLVLPDKVRKPVRWYLLDKRLGFGIPYLVFAPRNAGAFAMRCSVILSTTSSFI
jgi:hypothetical protein